MTTTEIPSFVYGGVYKRSLIHKKFGGNSWSGISASADTPAIFIFWSPGGAKFGYQNFWDEDRQVFTYTGEGKTGDMAMTKGNAALKDHIERGRAVHLFQLVNIPKKDRTPETPDGNGIYKYLGEMQCAGVLEGHGQGEDGVERKVFQFQLVRVDAVEKPAVTGGEAEPAPQPLTTPNDLGELRRRAQTATKPPSAKTSNARRSLYERSQHVVNYALARAAGSCEHCGTSAPFLKTDGAPYLEVHHVDRVSDGGLDAPDKVAAICPTCHRWIHHGKEGFKLNDALREKIAALEAELAKSDGA